MKRYVAITLALTLAAGLALAGSQTTGGLVLPGSSGSAGQVLTSAGAGSPCTWGAAGGGTIFNSWDATAGIAPIGTDQFMTLDTVGAVSGHHCLDADDASAESAIFRGAAHAGYDAGTITLTIWFSAASATTGEMIFSAAWQDLSGQDMSADSYDTKQSSAAITVPGTDDTMTSATITFTQAEADGIAAGDPFSMLVWREAERTDDDATGDAQIHRVTIEW